MRMTEQEACLYVLFQGHPGNIEPMSHVPLLTQATLATFLAAIPAEWPTFRDVVEKVWLPRNGYTVPRTGSLVRGDIVRGAFGLRGTITHIDDACWVVVTDADVGHLEYLSGSGTPEAAEWRRA